MIFNMGHGSRGKGAETEQADRNGSSAAKHRRAFLMLRSATWGADSGSVRGERAFCVRESGTGTAEGKAEK